MRAAPFLHQPYRGPARPFSIGLNTLDLKDWIEPDAHLLRDLAEKETLFTQCRDTVYRAESGSFAAGRETLDLLAEHLPRRFPDLYRRGGDVLVLRASGQEIALADEAPLLSAARLVQEDLCVLQREERGWRLSAAALCFPSTWSLAEKIGTDMSTIHQGVPGYPGVMGERVARIFDHLKPDLPVWRLNWSIYGDDHLHHPEPKSDPQTRFRAAMPMEEGAFIRVERQTLRRLPVSDAILFTIRVYVDPMAVLLHHPEGAVLAQALRAQVLAMTPEQLDYKGLTQHRDKIAAALQALAVRSEQYDG